MMGDDVETNGRQFDRCRKDLVKALFPEANSDERIMNQKNVTTEDDGCDIASMKPIDMSAVRDKFFVTPK